MNEMVNHPDHYRSSIGDVIDIIEGWGLGFCLGNVLKYICRAGKKPGESSERDLEKARFYVSRALKNHEYCGPGTYKASMYAPIFDDEELLPDAYEVMDAFSLEGYLAEAVLYLYKYACSFDRADLEKVEEFISEKLIGGKENE